MSDFLDESSDTTPSNAFQRAVPADDSPGRRVREAALQQVHAAASFLSEHADTPIVGRVANEVASGLERTASYIDDATLTSVTADMRGAVRAAPLRTLAIGLGVGVLLGRLTERR